MSEWFVSTGEELSGKQGLVTEVLCELPPRPTERIAGALGSRQLSAQDEIHGDDLLTFPALCGSEDASSRRRRLVALRTAAAQLETAFQAFGQDRDRDDFLRLWVTYLAPHTPQRLLSGGGRVPQPQASGVAASDGIAAGESLLTLTSGPARAAAAAAGSSPVHSGGIPTLLLSTNGASTADRLDLYGSFARYLREQQGAYVALLQPEDLAAGVGGCFTSALAQLSGLPEAAAEDVMGLVAWYESETGRGMPLAPTQAAQAAAATAGADEGAPAVAAAITAPKTPGKKAGAGAKTPAKGGSKGAAAKTPGKAGGRGSRRGAAEGGADGEEKENDGGEAAAGEGGDADADGTVAARLRARRGQAGQAAAAAAEAEAQLARRNAAAAAARNQRRHVVLMLEGAGRVSDRGALRALLAALHGERHRLPVVLVLGLSCPAALYGTKLPADVASQLQMTAADLAPHPQQLHRLFQDVLLSPSGPSTAPLLLLDGAAMRELLVQSRLLEPSLAGLQAALLEAHEQHFRREPLAALALLPLAATSTDSDGDDKQQPQQQPQQQGDQNVGQQLFAAAGVEGGRDGDAVGRQDSRPGATTKRRQQEQQPRRRRSGSSSSGTDSDSSASSSSSSYVSVQSQQGEEVDHKDLAGKDGAAGDEGRVATGCGGASSLAQKLERRRHAHMERLAAAVSELPKQLVRAAASTTCDAGSAGAAARGRDNHQAADTVSLAVAEAFGALSSWRLGLQWLAALAERTGALRQPGGQRYTLPSLYVAAASPNFWKPLRNHGSFMGSQAGCTSVGASLVSGLLGPTAALAAAAAGSEIMDVTGAAAGRAAAGGGGGVAARGPLRNMPEQELLSVLDELRLLGLEALTRGWMPSEAVQRAVQGLSDLAKGIEAERAAAAAAAGAVDPAEAEVDETSPVRRRLAAQGLTSPPTLQKLMGITDRLGRMGGPLPAPKMLQLDEGAALQDPEPSQQPEQQQQQQQQAPAKKGAAGGIKLPTSGQTQTKRQRDKALLAAVQQRAAAGPALLPAAGGSAAAGAGAAAAAGPSLADRAAEVLAKALLELLATSPFSLPGSAVFTFRDASGLQRRLVGAPSLALHTALTQPELALSDLQPGLHPGQEDAAIAYQLLVGYKDGIDLREWLAEFCAASGLGHVQDVREEDEEGEEEAEDDEAAAENGDAPMGRSRKSKRRAAPRKRRAAPKQEVVLTLDGPQAEAAVDALACRFEQVARELEAVGLCRFAKRRKGLYVQRTYFPPEAIA